MKKCLALTLMLCFLIGYVVTFLVCEAVWLTQAPILTNGRG
jgi:hypothetical protein